MNAQNKNTASGPAKSSRTIKFIAIAVVLAVCAVVAHSIREALHEIDETMCHVHLYKLRHALISYDGHHGSLPPAALINPQTNVAKSWRVLILPYHIGIADGAAIHAAYDKSAAWNSPKNRQLFQPAKQSRFASDEESWFACTCGSEDGTTRTSYVVLIGEDTLFPQSGSVSVSEIPETIDPILILEITNSDIEWPEPKDLSVNELTMNDEVNSVSLTKPHAAKIRYMTLRGKLGVLPPGTTREVLMQLASIKGHKKLVGEQP